MKLIFENTNEGYTPETPGNGYWTNTLTDVLKHMKEDNAIKDLGFLIYTASRISGLEDEVISALDSAYGHIFKKKYEGK